MKQVVSNLTSADRCVKEARCILIQVYTAEECQSTEAILIDCVDIYGETTGKIKWKKQNINYALKLPVIVVLITSFLNSFSLVAFAQSLKLSSHCGSHPLL